MRLQFTILWFENQMDGVSAAIDALRDQLGQEGFDLDVVDQQDDSRLEELSNRQALYHEFDLVVVDYDLGNDARRGDAIARELRQRFSFTDIVFYSGQSAATLRQLIFDQEIDGVYCVERRSLRDSLLLLVETIVERISKLEAMRGLAVAACSRADDLFREVLVAAYATAPDDKKKALLDFLDKEVKDSGSRILAGYEELGSFDEKVRSRACGSFHLLKTMRHLLQDINANKSEAEILRTFQSEVLEVRNILGHATEAKTSDGWTITTGKGQAITRRDFSTYRSNFKKHLKNLEVLHKVHVSNISGNT